MALKILFVFATATEANTLKKLSCTLPYSETLSIAKCDIIILTTGIGGISTAWSMKQWLSNNPVPDLAINAGIAGSYKDYLKNGDVVMPVTDCFADMGVEQEGVYLTMAEAGLMDSDKFPFKEGFIKADNKYVDLAGKTLKKVKAITVNTSSGSVSSIERLKNKYNPDIETMEGATFFYICAMEKIPFLAVRAISNRVEPRNKNAWDIPLALENLTGKLEELLLILE
jgi:futalosine hydrolase